MTTKLQSNPAGRVVICAWMLTVWFNSSIVCSQEPQPSELLTVEGIFGESKFAAKNYQVRWQPDGTYLRLESIDKNADKNADAEDDKKPSLQKLVRYDVESGEATELLNSASLQPAADSAPLKIDDYASSTDHQRLLIYANSQRVWRYNSRGDYWVYDIAAKKLKQIGSRFPPASLMFAKFSPDGRSVAYVQENDIYIEQIDSGQIRQLTRKNSDSIIHGAFDWVYEEEFQIQDGFRWSPDGQRIAFWQLDTSEVPVFSLINNTDALYPTVQRIPWPKAGEQNAACRIGVVDVNHGGTQMIALPGDPRENYVPRIDWALNSRELAIQQLNRAQNELSVWLADVQTGNARRVFTDRDDAWVDVDNDFSWTANGGSFVWSSERTGWRRMYEVSVESSQPVALTVDGIDVIQFLGTNDKSTQSYFLASPDNPTECFLYSQQRGAQPVRITPADQPGWHAYELSPDMNVAVHRWSRFDQPTRTELIRVADHSVVRVLEDNEELNGKLASLRLGRTEFLRIKTDEDASVILDGWRILPPDFDPNRKYPLLVYVYSEPAGQTVTDRWRGDGYLWHQLLAQQGYIVMSFDSRGTPAPRGRQWRKSIYRRIGTIAIEDQASAVRRISAQDSFVDSDRVGIWGWSGGGTSSLHAIMQYPDLYRMAIAVAPMPDLRYYDTIYEERYMGTPQNNPDGYKSGSPITYAEQLRGKLLLIHGTGDDNCHYQTTQLLINELVRHKKQFSLMAYPNRSHSIREGDGTKVHLRDLMTEFVRDNL